MAVFEPLQCMHAPHQRYSIFIHMETDQDTSQSSLPVWLWHGTYFRTLWHDASIDSSVVFELWIYSAFNILITPDTPTDPDMSVFQFIEAMIPWCHRSFWIEAI